MSYWSAAPCCSSSQRKWTWANKQSPCVLVEDRTKWSWAPNQFCLFGFEVALNLVLSTVVLNNDVGPVACVRSLTCAGKQQSGVKSRCVWMDWTHNCIILTLHKERGDASKRWRQKCECLWLNLPFNHKQMFFSLLLCVAPLRTWSSNRSHQSHYIYEWRQHFIDCEPHCVKYSQ